MSHFASEILPSGVYLPFAGTVAPQGWLLCAGQAVSRTVYAKLFASIGITYGAGDGSTTFNLPDSRGRVVAGKDDMGGTAANRITSGVSGVTGTTLGSAGGTESVALATANLPSHSHTINHDHAVVTSSGASTTTTGGISANHTHGFSGTTASSLAGFTLASNAVVGASGAGGVARFEFFGATGASAHTHTFSGTTGTVSSDHTHQFPHTHTVDVAAFSGSSGNTGSGTEVSRVQPVIIANYIIKI